MSYVLEIVVDGQARRMTLDTMPASIVARLYSVPAAPALVLLAEKVLK